jgi:hypothetical protein
MLMIRPIKVTEGVLADSNVPELLPNPWKGETVYGEGDHVVAPNIVSQELIENGEFLAGATGWTGGAGIVITDVATFTATAINLANSAIAVAGMRYRMEVDYAITAGLGLQATVAGAATYAPPFASPISPNLSGSGTVTLEFIAQTTGVIGVAAANAVYSGTISRVSVKLVENSVQTYEAFRSLVAANVGNDPASSPDDWLSLGEVHGYWSPTTMYAEGEKVPGGQLGAQLVLNSEFDSDLSNWHAELGAPYWVAGGFVRISETERFHSDYFATTIGRRYRGVVNVAALKGGGIYLGPGRPFNAMYKVLWGGDAGVYEFEWIAEYTSYELVLQMTTVGASGYMDIAYARVYEVDSDQKLYESVSGVKTGATITIASPAVVTVSNHGLVADTPISFRSTGGLPTGLTINTVYYVRDPTTSSFKVSATPGGANINTSGTQVGSHEVIANPNVNNRPEADDGSNWLTLGPTNRWAMFDDSVGTITTDPNAIDFTLDVTGTIDSLALLSMVNATSVQVIVTVTPEGEVYNETFDLTSEDGIIDWYTYLFEPIERQTNLLITDLPSFNNPEVRVIITGSSDVGLTVGNFTIGQKFDLGRALYGAQVGIKDYSRKEADEFGNYEIVRRAFSKRGSFRCRIAKGQVDAVADMLALYRATAAVYSASELYDATLFYGFFTDFNIEIDYPNESLVSIDIEGLS